MSTVKSESDDRVVNNVMRHEYRVLSDAEKMWMKAIKDKGLEFHNLLRNGASPELPFASRELILAATRVEEAVMWAVKHITK